MHHGSRVFVVWARYQVEAKQQRAKRGDEENIEEVPREATRP